MCIPHSYERISLKSDLINSTEAISIQTSNSGFCNAIWSYPSPCCSLLHLGEVMPGHRALPARQFISCYTCLNSSILPVEAQGFCCCCDADFCWLSLSILIHYALGKLQNHSHQLLHKLDAGFLCKNFNKLQMHEKTGKSIRTQEFLNTHTKLLLYIIIMWLIDYHITVLWNWLITNCRDDEHKTYISVLFGVSGIDLFLWNLHNFSFVMQIPNASYVLIMTKICNLAHSWSEIHQYRWWL